MRKYAVCFVETIFLGKVQPAAARSCSWEWVEQRPSGQRFFIRKHGILGTQYSVHTESVCLLFSVVLSCVCCSLSKREGRTWGACLRPGAGGETSLWRKMAMERLRRSSKPPWVVPWPVRTLITDTVDDVRHHTPSPGPSSNPNPPQQKEWWCRKMTVFWNHRLVESFPKTYCGLISASPLLRSNRFFLRSVRGV